MKLKSIIACGIALLSLGAATTSCEDMFTADNKLVTTDLAPKDTVYQVMGIINGMQKLAERTVLLGELRGDLVDVDPAHSTTHMQELGANRVSEDNIYNQPSDYYAVINNCNVYLAHVDSLYKVHGKFFYKNETIAVKTFRAWCYLELCKIYGSVPFITEPVLSSVDADNIVNSGSKSDMVTITSWLIDDLKGYAYEPQNNELRPCYSVNPATSEYSEYFIPVRVMLGELYLWRGTMTGSQSDYIDAVRMYHNYLTFPNEEHNTNNRSVEFTSTTFRNIMSSYTNSFHDAQNKNDYVGALPLDTLEFYGNTCDLRAVFNSVGKQNYYPAARPSSRMDSISRAQIVSKVQYISAGEYDVLYAPRDKSEAISEKAIGDLRQSEIIYENTVNNKYHAEYNRQRIYNAKYLGGSMSISNDVRMKVLPYYRITTIYLHMAEALNRAGFPMTAFAVLKWGITEEVLMNRSIVSQDEFDRLAQIKAYGFTATSLNYENTEGNGSFLVWNPNKFVTYNKLQAQGGTTIISGGGIQVGIHSLGSGDSEYNKYYSLDSIYTNLRNLSPEQLTEIVDSIGYNPQYEPKWNKKDDPDTLIYNAEYAAYSDSLAVYQRTSIRLRNYLYTANKADMQDYVAKRILDEEALELCYEGTRFYDLMRYVRQEGDMSNNVVLPPYIKQEYGSCPAVDNKYDGTSWYLPLRKR